jgi:hypothetical protein
MKPPNDDFERKSVSVLRNIGFRAVSYYQYPYSTEILGYVKPRPPLTIPLKLMVAIVRSRPTAQLINSFHQTGKNALADRLVIFSPTDPRRLTSEAQRVLSRSRIEFFGGKIIDELARAKPRERIQDIVSAKRLIDAISQLSLQTVPSDLSEYADILNVQPWQIFEDAIFVAFQFCFHYRVRQFGKETLLEREPEGVAITTNDKPFAIVYDCKSAKRKYHMSVDDERAYVEYILKKKSEVRSLDNSEVLYFLVVSPDFKGQLDSRRKNVAAATGVQMIFLKAQALQRLASWAYDLPSNLSPLIDLREVFKRGKDPVVTTNDVEDYIRRFDEEYKKRY